MTMPSAETRPDPEQGGVGLGILLLLGAVSCFAGLDATAKWINRSADPVQTAALRTIVSFVVVAAFCRPWRSGEGGFAASARPWVQVGRGLSIVAATLCSFFALRHLPLPQATAITFAAPLITALLSGPLLGEWPGPHRVAAAGVGFLGVLVVTRPWSGGLVDPAMGLALATALFNSLYALATRVAARRDPPLTTLLWSGAVGSAVLLPALLHVWAPPGSAAVWAALFGLGVLGAAGHWLLILAHARAPAATLAPFFYAQLLGAVALGWLVFGQWPDATTLAGGLIVAGSGLYMLRRERMRSAPPSADIPA